MTVQYAKSVLKDNDAKNALLKKCAISLINELLPEYEHLSKVEIILSNDEDESAFNLKVTFFDKIMDNKTIRIYSFFDKAKILIVYNYVKKFIKNKSSQFMQIDENLHL